MRAMILAAGRGERMRPLTDTTPKPLLRAGGKPLITWHIERLVTAGITDIIINHAWLGQQIEDALGSGERWGARLRYSPETSPLETAGGIARALPFFEEKPFLVINGDIWCDWDPAQATSCASVLAEQNALAWLLLVDNPDHHPGGDFALPVGNGDNTSPKTDPVPACARIQALDSKGGAPQGARSFTFAGVGVYSPDLFGHVDPTQAAALAPLLRRAVIQGRLIGSHHGGQWTDVGTPQRLNSLDISLSARS